MIERFSRQGEIQKLTPIPGNTYIGLKGSRQYLAVIELMWEPLSSSVPNARNDDDDVSVRFDEDGKGIAFSVPADGNPKGSDIVENPRPRCSVE
jgi:hypothetical protein